MTTVEPIIVEGAVVTEDHICMKGLPTDISHREWARIRAKAQRRKNGAKAKPALTEEQIVEVRAARASGMSLSKIMYQYPVGYRKLVKLLGEDKKEKKEVVENDVEIAVETNKEDPVTQL